MRIKLTLLLVLISTAIFGQYQSMTFNDYSFVKQLNVGNGTATSTQASAALEIKGTTRGFLPPRLTQTQRDAIASPAPYLTIVNTTTGKYQYYYLGAWIDMFSAPAQTLETVTGAGKTTHYGVQKLSSTGTDVLVDIGEDDEDHGLIKVIDRTNANAFTNIYPSAVETNEFIPWNAARNGNVHVKYTGGSGSHYQTLQPLDGTIALTSDITTAVGGYVPTSRTITINGTALDLSTNRSWSVGLASALTVNSSAEGLAITGVSNFDAENITSKSDLTIGDGISDVGDIKWYSALDPTKYLTLHNLATVNGTVNFTKGGTVAMLDDLPSGGFASLADMLASSNNAYGNDITNLNNLTAIGEVSAPAITVGSDLGTGELRLHNVADPTTVTYIRTDPTVVGEVDLITPKQGGTFALLKEVFNPAESFIIPHGSAIVVLGQLTGIDVFEDKGLTFPDPADYPGEQITVINLFATSEFRWKWEEGGAIRKPDGSSLTGGYVEGQTTYILESDGTNWVVVSRVQTW